MERYKVVIIDDEPWTRQVIKDLGQWDKLGLEVVGEASDGEFGMELILHLDPDIIITDVKMPHLNGMELVSQLRAQGNDAFIIVISGYDDYNFIRTALKHGVIDYLLKPIKPEELNTQLSHCKEELIKRSHKKDNTDKLINGFLDVSWSAEYYKLLDEIHDSLYSGDPGVIQQKFKKMQCVFNKTVESKITKGHMVVIYYTMMNSLQRFISASGYALREVFAEQEISYTFRNNISLESMLTFLCDLYCTTGKKIQTLIRDRNKLDIREIQEYLMVHYTEGITLEQTAARFYISKEYLSKTFKSSTGKGFSEYITTLRMEKARKFILEYKVPLKEIGFLVGYQDQAHFYKAFRKYYGITPGSMRQG